MNQTIFLNVLSYIIAGLSIFIIIYYIVKCLLEKNFNDTGKNEEENELSSYFNESQHHSIEEIFKDTNEEKKKNNSMKNKMKNVLKFNFITELFANKKGLKNQEILDYFQSNSNVFDEFDINNNNNCKMCSYKYEKYDIVIKFKKCGHYLHKICFIEWAKNNRKCPNCNEKLL